jgi:hypothetical protein
VNKPNFQAQKNTQLLILRQLQSTVLEKERDRELVENHLLDFMISDQRSSQPKKLNFNQHDHEKIIPQTILAKLQALIFIIIYQKM